MNPIRRVVTLLQEMAKKITEEGEQKADNLECYCGTTSQELKTNVEGSARITDSTSKIQAEEGILVELKTVIKVSQESRVEKRWISQFGILEELFVFDRIVHFGAILRRRDVCIWRREVCVNTRSQ